MTRKIIASNAEFNFFKQISKAYITLVYIVLSFHRPHTAQNKCFENAIKNINPYYEMFDS